MPRTASLPGVSSLRVALLAMTEPAETGQPLPRAFLRVGGNTIARHQLTLALALDCQRVICIARDLSPDLIALQHAAEDAGVQFHVVPGARALLQLVTGVDELLVLNEGLLVEPRAARGLQDDHSSGARLSCARVRRPCASDGWHVCTPAESRPHPTPTAPTPPGAHTTPPRSRSGSSTSAEHSPGTRSPCSAPGSAPRRYP